MAFQDKTITDFAAELSSAAPVPGGGSVSALVGALGTCLASMVGRLTAGKAKYADVEEEVLALTEEADEVSRALLALIDADAEAFAPLSRAYGIPKSDPARFTIMEDALRGACEPPLETMRIVCRAVEIHARMARIGSRLALSDAGVGAAMCRAALQSTSMNVFINTRLMSDRDRAASIEAEADALMGKYGIIADMTYFYVMSELRK